MFVQTDTALVRLEAIIRVDLETFAANGTITIHEATQSSVASGTYAIETLLLLKPSALEGTRVRWIRHAWVFHNLVGHPLMQVLAWLRLPSLAVRVHDATVPGSSLIRTPSH
ncbi:hypothetical protein KBA73_03015 [Patescibacteria group bacterium]|nr:hypothetical protein [Patescibacteria group bacterium]